MAYTFEQLLAADPSNPANVAQNAAITIFEPGDVTMAPLTLTDPDGSPLPNPFQVNANGFGPAFAHATLDRVAWSGGGFTGFVTSYEGMKAEAVAARTAAETAAADAAAAAQADLEARIASGVFKGEKGADGANVLPTDTAIKEAIANPASATRGELNATYAGKSVEAAVSGIVKGAGSTRQIGAFVNKLKKGAQSAVITALGDSTGASPTGWLIELVRDKIAPAFAAYTVISRDWEDANQRYNPASNILQTGTAGLRRLVATGASTDWYFLVPDSAATSPSSELDVRFKVTIPALGSAITFGGKYDTVTNNRSWFLTMNANNTLSLFFSTDGTSATQLTRTSTAAVPSAAVGVPVWIRSTFDGDDGAGNNVARFYYSADNVNWTQIGSTVTNAGVQTLFDSNMSTQLNSRGAGGGNPTGGAVEYHGMQVYTSLAAGARPVIDIITGLWHGYANDPYFPDLAGNTVQASTTGSTGSMQGAPILLFLNGCVSGQAVAYANDATRQPRLTPVKSDLAVINYSHNEQNLVIYRAPYKQLADALIAKWADVGIIATAQNPRKAPAIQINEHAIRTDQVNALAASQGYALVDAYNTLAADMNLVLADGIHPTDAGYDAIRDVAYKLFNAWI